MIPLEILSKMSIYYVEFNGKHVKTRVVTEYSLVKEALDELKVSISSFSYRVMGIDLISSNSTNILVLQTESVCVIFDLKKINSSRVGEDLDTFLKDETICFVGLDTIKEISYVTTKYSIRMVRLGELAGRILKRTSLCDSSNLVEIAKAIGHGVDEMPYCPSALKIIIDSKLVYSPEEVKVMISNAYACYRLSCKLYRILSEVAADPVKKQPKSQAT